MEDLEGDYPPNRILPLVPAIASQGILADNNLYLLMQLAADRLNESYNCVTSYRLAADRRGQESDDQRRVYLRGQWVDSLLQREHLLNFVLGVAELDDELSASTLDWAYEPPLSQLIAL